MRISGRVKPACCGYRCGDLMDQPVVEASVAAGEQPGDQVVGRPGWAGELPGNGAQAAAGLSGGAVLRPWGTGAALAAGGWAWSRGASLRLAVLGRLGHRSAASFVLNPGANSW